MNNHGGKSLETARADTGYWFIRNSWMVFLFLSAVLLLFGVTDLPSATSSTARENAINELFIGCLTAWIAVIGLRRRQRWAWVAMTLWPVWIGAQGLRAASAGATAEMVSAFFLLILTLVALALSFAWVAEVRR